MAAPLPWFPLYIADFEFDEAVRLMSWEERGVYLALLCWQWREGSIPSNPTHIKQAMGAPVAAIRTVLRRCFRDDGEHVGRSINPKLAELRVNQLTKAGKNSANARGWKTTEERFLYAARLERHGLGNGPADVRIKIGWSRSPKNRVAAVARDAGGSMTLLGMRPATINLERKAHLDLAAHRLEGEWFRDVPLVHQWLATNGVTGETSGNTNGSGSGDAHGLPGGETSVRSRIRREIQKSLSARADGNGTTPTEPAPAPIRVHHG